MFDQIKGRIFAYIASRLAEPSTRVALLALLGTLGMKISPDLGEVIVDVLIVFLGGAAATPDTRLSSRVPVPPGNPPDAGSGSSDSPFLDQGH